MQCFIRNCPSETRTGFIACAHWSGKPEGPQANLAKTTQQQSQRRMQTWKPTKPMTERLIDYTKWRPLLSTRARVLFWRGVLSHRSKNNNNNNNKSNNDNRKGSDTSHTGQIPVRESSIVYPPSQQEELISLVFSLHCLRLLPPRRRLSGKTLLQPAEERDIIHRRCVKSNRESWNYLFHKNKIVQNKFNLGEEF